MNLDQAKKQLLADHDLTKEQMLELLRNYTTDELCALGGTIREHLHGNYFDTCSIVNARSGRCSENCKWCAQSIHFKTDIEEYELISPEQCEEMAAINARYGVNKFSFVTSGRALNQHNIDRICQYAENIKNKHAIRLCASMGLLNKKQLGQLQASGIERYHCNLESSPRHFATLCSTHSQEEKIKTIRAAQELGMDVCSGGIIGMGETMEDRIDLAILLRDLGVISIPINLLMPIPGTPLAESTPLSDDEILRSIVCFRLLNPRAMIRFAGGRKLIKHIEKQAIAAGVNAAIVGDLLTTIGSDVEQDMQMLSTLGFKTAEE